jgi:hypothetical protein
MDSQTWIRYFEAAPEQVRAYLLDMSSAEAEKRAQRRLGYENDAWERVMDIAWETIFMGRTRQEFIERIRKIAGDRKPDEVERAVLKEVVLPLADLVVWDVEGRLQELGVPMSDIQAVDRVTLRPVSYGAAVRRAAADAKISLFSEEMVRRLRDLYVSYVKAVRTEDQFRETLQRPQSDGGMGFTREQTVGFIDAIDALSDEVRILSETEYADWFAAFQNETQGQTLIQPKDLPVPDENDDTVTSSGPRGEPTHVVLRSAIEAALAQIGDLGLDDYAKKRLENIVSTRLRDVRNAEQVRQILAREPKVGGLGLAPEKAESLADTLEKIYIEQRAAIVEEEKQKISSVLAEQQQRIDERRKRESEEHAKWYQEKVRQARNDEQRAQDALAQMKKSFQAAPAGSATPSSPPTLDAVKAPPKLMGLTEEVGGMTLAEFRRLAKNPDDAANKIWQKFLTLQEESFDRYTEGVQAWRQSPLQQLYLRLVAESFAAGKPVAQVVQEKRQADPSMPSTEELAAIIQLNTKIQL